MSIHILKLKNEAEFLRLVEINDAFASDIESATFEMNSI